MSDAAAWRTASAFAGSASGVFAPNGWVSKLNVM